MATEHRMIEPFEPELLRHSATYYNPAISYGTSSYGYDVRCADEFKVFTNATILLQLYIAAAAGYAFFRLVTRH